MADKIAKKEGIGKSVRRGRKWDSRQFKDCFFSFLRRQSPEILKKFLLTNWPPIIALGLSFTPEGELMIFSDGGVPL